MLRRLREALRDMGEHKMVAERKRLNDELDNVRGELSELKARLAKVEAGKAKAVSASKSQKSPRASTPNKAKRKSRT